jgi:hypothetical protein
MLFKKGAMFGLDARIALAIFGALSVISGAALYSAIQDAKVTKIITEMTEHCKAWEQYYLDTGDYLQPYDDSDPNSSLFYHNQNKQLIENDEGVAGWKGPYTSLKYAGGVHIIYPEAKYIDIITLEAGKEFGQGVAPWTGALCTAGKRCMKYISVIGIEDEPLIRAIDVKVDGSDTPSTGKIRWWDTNPSWEAYRLHMACAPAPNPN